MRDWSPEHTTKVQWPEVPPRAHPDVSPRRPTTPEGRGRGLSSRPCARMRDRAQVRVAGLDEETTMKGALKRYTSGLGRAAMLAAVLLVLASAETARGQADPLPSWNDGPAKQSIVKFVQAVTDAASPQHVPPAARIAVFDNDG